jgi:integrase
LQDYNFRRRQWAPAVEDSSLEPLTFHDLRHSHASLLIRYGWQDFKIVRRLGWKDATMLHRTYGHLFPQHDSNLVVELEQHLQDARSGNAKVVSIKGR